MQAATTIPSLSYTPAFSLKPDQMHRISGIILEQREICLGIRLHFIIISVIGDKGALLLYRQRKGYRLTGYCHAMRCTFTGTSFHCAIADEIQVSLRLTHMPPMMKKNNLAFFPEQ